MQTSLSSSDLSSGLSWAAQARAGLQGPVRSAVRTAGPQALAQALIATRARTLGLMQAWHQALPDLRVPPLAGLNPPLWEWGHVAWFQEWWTVRHGQRLQGTQSSQSARSGAAFGPSLWPQADAWYNSSEVPHSSRPALPLPDFERTQHYLSEVLALCLANLAAVPALPAFQAEPDQALYFWRLALQHEDMHNEASVFMAQALGLALPEALAWRAPGPHGASAFAAAGASLHVPAQSFSLGQHGPGFAFDNECQAHSVTLGALAIDAAPVTWAQYLPFLQATGHTLPPHLRATSDLGVWQVQRWGQWQTLQAQTLQTPVVHVNAFDAQAWCQWAGRRLPSEAEWECAAQHPGFVWGQVWEWTDSDFAPYPGFVAHPYRDYSEPWWQQPGSHRVLRGASAATSAHVADLRYRNFFAPERRDVLAGFRSVAL